MGMAQKFFIPGVLDRIMSKHFGFNQLCLPSKADKFKDNTC